jgi:peptidyl-prolyl cis-trans isomerase A (cyclophilin A)
MYGKFRLLAGVATAMLFSAQSSATIVQFQTNMGSFDVNLYDQGTPATVANFLAYVNAGRFANSIVHRSQGGFVVQGGGYLYQGPGTTLGTVTQNPAVTNEPEYSNVRGTISMAKLGGNANSATSQWFINTGNNSANLDVQNGGFTVFGQVTGNGMTVVDAMNALQIFNMGPGIAEIPLRNYTTQNANNQVPVTDQHLVIITSIIVLNPAVNTVAGLLQVPNTLIDQPPPTPDPDTGGGGATGLGSLLLLGALNLWRQCRSSSR